MLKLIKILLGPKTLLKLALSYTFLLLVLSLISLEKLPDTNIKFADKIAHGIAYFLFFINWFLYVFFKSKTPLFSFKSNIIKVLVFGMIYGIIIEVLQTVATHYRQGDFLDLLANSLGLLLGAILVFIMRAKLKGLKK